METKEKMTLEEMVGKLVSLEHYPPRLQGEELDKRRAACLQAVDDFEPEVLGEVCRNYNREENEFFPSPGELRRMCVELVSRKERQKRSVPSSSFHPQEHEHRDSRQTAALAMLAVIWKYESAHVSCPKKTLATCPKCGVRHALTNPTIRILMKAYPDQTENWNDAHKGMALCPQCDVQN